MATNIEKIPRIHCFGGPRVSLDDICDKSEECEKTECLWHEKRGKVPSRLGMDNNRTEAMSGMLKKG